MKHIFYVLGITGSGRHTLCGCLRNEIPCLRIAEFVRCEIESVESYFLNKPTLYDYVPLEDKLATNADGETCFFMTTIGDKDREEFIAIGDLDGYVTMKDVFGDRLIPIYIKSDNKAVLERMLTRIDKNTGIEKYCKQFVMETETYRQSNLEAARIKKGFYCKPGVYGFYELLYDVRKYMQMIISRDGGMED